MLIWGGKRKKNKRREEVKEEEVEVKSEVRGKHSARATTCCVAREYSAFPSPEGPESGG